MKDDFSSARRTALRKCAVGSAAVVATVLFPAAGLRAADAAERVSEDDPTAVQLKYVHDASESEVRKDSTQFCHNCRYFKGTADTAWAPCTIFAGKAVAAEGWCNVWAKR